MTQKKRDRGFSLIEVLVGLFLVAVAVLGLAELFLLAVANNRNADRIANATFLARQEIDWLRGLTATELGASGALTDEALDLNQDGTNDFRRVTQISAVTASTFQVSVRVYSAEKLGISDPETLIDNPGDHRPRAFISTIISR
jgi:type IV pilus assembly protein PilV